MVEPLFLKPVFHAKIWGGRHLATDFGYQIPEGTIGECWAISGHPHGPNIITNGQYEGQLLPKIYQQHPELFGNPCSSVFPLLTKILDANASLSIQVHPDDAYAEEHEHELGKTECWYVIHAEPGAYLTYGHTAKTRDELIKMIDNHQWSKLFSKKPVKTGDFIYVPSGTIHALNKGIIVLETQQSSDTTYRIYDYDRQDKKTGQLRQLHLRQAKDVTTVPFTEPQIISHIVHDDNSIITTLISQPDSPFFTVYKWEIHDQTSLTHEHGPYTLVSIIDGNGILTVDNQQYSLHKGEHFIIPATIKSWTMDGELLAIASEPTN